MDLHEVQRDYEDTIEAVFHRSAIGKTGDFLD